MLLGYALLALVAVGCLYGLAIALLSRTEQIAPAAADRPPWALPDEALAADDVVGLRLPVALRGYRFAETDLLLDRLTDELRMRDEEIARLRAMAGPAASATTTASIVEPTAADLDDASAPPYRGF
jgi:hypothetical protein